MGISQARGGKAMGDKLWWEGVDEKLLDHLAGSE